MRAGSIWATARRRAPSRRARSGWVAAVLLLVLAGCGGADKPPTPTPTAAARRTPAPRTDPAAVAARGNVPVLCYHQIRNQTSADSAADRAYIVSPAALEAQMRALDRAGYTPVTGDAFVAHVARGAKLPPKPILLTFDDASAGQYSKALPILRRHHFVATFFVMTVVLDKPGWMTRGQVRALDRAGMTIGGHTYDHKPVPEYAGDDWKTQLDAPGRELRKIVGHKVPLFAYPYGSYTAGAVPHLFSAGYRAAFQLAEKYDKRHPLWNLRRIIVPELTGKQLLHAIRADF
jgi:peptidoglycan/xylan/chitin deacetylase (PgdA/CDA1 family)